MGWLAVVQVLPVHGRHSFDAIDGGLNFGDAAWLENML
jgi:hypothetical protein